LGFQNQRFDGPNREDFGYKLKSIWSFFRVELGQKGVDLGFFEGVIRKVDLGIGKGSFKG